MQPLAEPVQNLIDAFTALPGIGPKTASRLAYYLLRGDESIALNLARALEVLKTSTVFCSVCHNIADRDPCPICTDHQRDHGLICVVEEPLDLVAIERSRAFAGQYHVLHGAISPVEGIGPDDLKVAELVTRLEQGEFEELIIATNATLEGDSTAYYLQRRLQGLNIRLTRLARGLPVGGDLEYTDEVTLGRALEGRREL